MRQLREDGALKPIGLALTAVVAGLGVAAPEIASTAEATRDPVQEEQLRPLRGDAVEPFAEQAQPQQPDLFEL